MFVVVVYIFGSRLFSRKGKTLFDNENEKKSERDGIDSREEDDVNLVKNGSAAAHR